jgi:hypothetical protein
MVLLVYGSVYSLKVERMQMLGTAIDERRGQ